MLRIHQKFIEPGIALQRQQWAHSTHFFEDGTNVSYITQRRMQREDANYPDDRSLDELDANRVGLRLWLWWVYSGTLLRPHYFLVSKTFLARPSTIMLTV